MGRRVTVGRLAHERVVCHRGMETSVFILLMLATLTAHLERRLVTSAVLAALSFLTRPMQP